MANIENGVFEVSDVFLDMGREMFLVLRCLTSIIPLFFCSEDVVGFSDVGMVE